MLNGGAAALVAVLLLSSCSGLTEREQELVRKHVFAFDGGGFPIDLASDRHKMGPLEFRERVQFVIGKARDWLDTEREARRKGKILLFFHGGLNDYRDSIGRSGTLEQILEEGEYYPIFVAWDSSLFTNYRDSLLLSEGRFNLWNIPFAFYAPVKDLIVGLITTPKRFVSSASADYILRRGELAAADSIAIGLRDFNVRAADVVAAITDEETASGLDGAYAASFVRGLEVEVEDLELRSGGPISFPMDSYRYSPLSPKWLLQPARWVTSVLVEGHGRGAWQGMKRRLQLMVEPETADPRGHGAFLYLLRQIKVLQTESTTFELDPGLVGRRPSEEEGLLAVRRVLQNLPRSRVRELLASLPSALPGTEIKALLKGALGRFGVTKGFVLDPSDQDDWISSALDWLSTDVMTAEAKVKLLKSVVSGDNASKWMRDVADSVHALSGDRELAASAGDVLYAIRSLLLDIESHEIELLAEAGEKILEPATTASLEELDELIRLVIARIDYRLGEIQHEDVRVDVVAHSMGAMLVNELLVSSRDRAVPAFGGSSIKPRPARSRTTRTPSCRT